MTPPSNKRRITTVFRLGCTLVLMLMNLFGTAQDAVKKYPSLLWEISGNGATKPSYVYGTMHVSSKLAFHLGDSFFLALQSCGVVALESDPSTWLKEMFDSTFLEDNGGLYRASTYYNDFYKEAFEVKELSKRIIGSSLNISGRMMNGMLYRNSAYNADFEEDTYLDMYIFQAGKKLHKTVIGLEDFQESSKMVALSRIPDDDEDDQPVNMDYRKMLRSGKSPADMLQDAYRNEDLDMVDSLQRMMNPGKNHQKYMLHDRNEIMVHQMDSIIKTGESLFSGIGAAHLAGEKGVIEMLRKMGYSVRPVSRLIAETSKKYRDSLEKTFIRKPMEVYNTADGLISVKMPAPFFEIPSNGPIKMYFYPEMTNGTNYSLIRIRHGAALLNQTTKYIQKRIDSLLYENIPGKIIEQKEIVRDGFVGWDIYNRTKKSDYERYIILVTPIEIIIFKVGGTLEYLKDNNKLEEVFASFHIQPDDKTWKTFQSKYGFSVELPGRVLTDEHNNELIRLLGNEVDVMAYGSQGDYYSLKRVSLHEHDYIEEDTFELTYLAGKLNKSLKLSELSRTLGSCGHMPCLKMVSKDSSGYMHSMYAIDGPRYYQLLAHTADSIWPERFFGSFVLHSTPPQRSYLFEDTACFYTVQTTTKPAGWSTLNLYERMMGGKKNDQSGFQGRWVRRVFADLQSNEEILLSFWQFPKYYFCPSYDSLWRIERNRYQNKGLFLYHETMSADSNEYAIQLSDTNSNRLIHLNFWVKNGVLYKTAWLGTQHQPPGAFVEQFIRTFTIDPDTAIGKPFNENKADIFLADLTSGDSLSQIHALSSFYQITFTNEQVPQLIDLIEGYKHKEFTLENRVMLIEELGRLKHKRIMPYLRLIYNRSIDTAQLQMAVLQALVWQKTPAATREIVRLMESETPLVQNYLVGSFFGAMYDSMDLYKDLYPFLLQYTHYPEYKDHVYGLMANMLDSGVLKPKRYRKHKKELVREAKDALKRIMAGNYNSGYSDYEDYEVYDDWTQTAASMEENYDGYGTSAYSFGTSDIASFNTLLFPFKKDKNVREYFERTRRLNSDKDLLTTSLQFLKAGISVNDTIWTHFGNRDDFRLILYKGLKYLNRLDLMADSNKTQEKLVRALMYQGDKLDDKDSLHMYKKVNAMHKKGPAFIYVYKRKEGPESKTWKYDYAIIIADDSVMVVTKHESFNGNNDFIDDEELDKRLEEVQDKLRYADRKRVKAQGRNYYQDMYGY